MNAAANQSTVLIVIDLQNGFITEESAHIPNKVADLVNRWQNAGGDVVFTQYLNYPGSPYERLIGWREVQTSPAIDFVPEVLGGVQRATAVIQKKIYSFFTEEGAALVKQHGWTDLYICGLDTESCVLKTAVDAFERDLTPWLISDVSASHAGQQAHEAGLFVARRFLGPKQIVAEGQIPVVRVAGAVLTPGI